MKIIIGLVGEKGSGKETFVQVLRECLSNVSINHVRTSDILKETLALWDLPITRRNLQDLAIVMDGGYGLGTLTRAMKARIEKDSSDIVIFDAVRWQSDAEMVRSFPKHFLVYITADIKTRYERTKARKEKQGESSASYEQFVEEEQIATELDIPKIGATAEAKILNNAGLTEYKAEVQKFCTAELNKVLRS